MSEVIDFAHTRVADEKRQEKARALAVWCWDAGVTPDEPAGWGDATRRWVARSAGVNPPSSWETWARVVGLLERKAEWVREHGDDGNPLGSGGRPEWLDAQSRPDAECERPVNTTGADPAPEKMISSADAERVTPLLPRGWAERVATGATLGHGRVCSTPRCIAPAVAAGIALLHCAQHPPTPGTWGSSLDWSPRAVTCAPSRCYCGACPSWRPQPTPASLQVEDAPPADARGQRDGARKAREAARRGGRR